MTGTIADHHMRVDRVSSTQKRVLIVVANPTTSSTLGWPVGFWGAELTHPYYELTERGAEVTIASPDGGKVEMDSLSDPRDESRWSADDLITMGFLNTPELVALLQDTPKLADPSARAACKNSTTPSPTMSPLKLSSTWILVSAGPAAGSS